MWRCSSGGQSMRLISKNLDRAIESGTSRSLILDFTDSEGKAISLDAPVKLSFQYSNTLFKQSDGSWANKIEFDMKQGQTSSIKRSAWNELPRKSAFPWTGSGSVGIMAAICIGLHDSCIPMSFQKRQVMCPSVWITSWLFWGPSPPIIPGNSFAAAQPWGPI